MAPLPKRRTATARKGKRRSHLALRLPPMVNCSQCHTPKLAHHVCATCGTYAGRQVIEIKSPKKR
ncbi:MAG: 50S ribosomal protein L32 [Chloroflexota bacterium]